MKKKQTIFFHNELPLIVNQLLIPKLTQNRIFTFFGPLGAGKTTIIKEILKKCGVSDIIISPTFNYVQHYKNSKGINFNHFDLYRIPDSDSFINAGFNEYLGQANTYTFIEWPEVIHEILQKKEFLSATCSIILSYNSEHPEARNIEIQST